MELEVPANQLTPKAELETKNHYNEQTIIHEKIMDSNGEIYLRKYLKGKQLGRGGFAKCFEVTDLQSKNSLAAKIIPRNSLQKERTKQKLISEIKIHKSLHHPNIVSFEHVFEDKENVYILLEICPNQTMNELIKRRKRLTELEVQNFSIQIINGLKYLHHNKVIHRDLKLGNFFLTDKMELKIGDFGLATKIEYEGERKKTICGTPNYIAPEVLDGKNGHSYEADIWSLGVILYTLLIGKAPFETSDIKTTYKKIKNNEYSFPNNVAISENAKELITQILVRDPAKRPTLDEIINHKFFREASKIPKLLPTSILSCPPSLSYLKQYIPNYCNNVKIAQQPQRIIETESCRLERSNENLKIIPTITSEKNELYNTTPKNDVFIKKWIDFSDKYGMGYILSNGAFGVFFNDGTNIFLGAGPSSFYFQEKKKKEENRLSLYSFDNFPSDLAKKVKIFQYFQSQLNYNPPLENFDENNLVYLRFWHKKSQCIMFVLNTKILQFYFTDKTLLIINRKNKLVTYYGKSLEKKLYPLNSALESSNMEMTKRLRAGLKIYSGLAANRGKNI